MSAVYFRGNVLTHSVSLSVSHPNDLTHDSTCHYVDALALTVI